MMNCNVDLQTERNMEEIEEDVITVLQVRMPHPKDKNKALGMMIPHMS